MRFLACALTTVSLIAPYLTVEDDTECSHLPTPSVSNTNLPHSLLRIELGIAISDRH